MKPKISRKVPSRHKALPVPGTKSASSKRAPKPSISIVDDNLDLISGMAKSLGEAGFETNILYVTHQSAEQIVDAIKEQNPTILLLDENLREPGTVFGSLRGRHVHGLLPRELNIITVSTSSEGKPEYLEHHFAGKATFEDGRVSTAGSKSLIALISSLSKKSGKKQ